MKRLIALSLWFLVTAASAQFDAVRTLRPDQGQEVRRPIEAKLFNSTNEELPAFEKELLDIFKDSSTTLEGRQYACRMLRFCASEVCIPVLAPKLLVEDLSFFVRMVFQGLESAAADDALIKTLTKIGNKKIKVGIIGTLGQRGSSASIKTITPYLKTLDSDVQLAAIIALGNIGGLESSKVLARAKVRPAHAVAWKTAQIQSAKSLKPEYAIKVLSQFRNDDNENIRVAVFIGIALAAPEKSTPDVIDTLGSDDLPMRNAAIVLLTSLPEELLIKELPGCSPEKQVLLIEAFASRRTARAEVAVLALTENENEAVRDAAFQALESIGGATSVTKLVKSIQSNAKAYDTLCALKATETDDALIEALKNSEDDKLRVKLIECLTARKSSEARPIFIELAKGDWSRTCKSAIDGLAIMADSNTFPVYAELMLATDNNKKILGLEQSIAIAAQRQSDAEACTQPLIAVYPNAKGEAQYAIIRSLGSIGGTSAHEMLAQSMTSTVPEIKDAAVRGLCNWPNTNAADQLIDLATNSDNEKYKVLALRGYIRLANGCAEEREAMFMCRKVVDVTDRPDVLKSVIACAKRFQTEDTINFLEPMLDNPAIANEAGWALIEVSWGWRAGPVSIGALEKTLEYATDEGLKRATQARIDEIKAAQ